MASTTAQIAKTKGNTSFKSGNWADAVGHYSAAVLADRSEPTYPLNRAAAYLKLGKYYDAERDCTTVLALDNKNVKALFRRAQARVALEKLSEAEKDLLHAINLEPANVSVKNELALVQKRRAEAAQKQASRKREPINVSPIPSSSQPQANPKPENEISHPPRIVRKVPIEIVEPDESEPISQSSEDFLKPIQSRVLSPSPKSSTSAPIPQSRVGAGVFHANGSYTILRTPTSEPASSPGLTAFPKSTESPPPSASLMLRPSPTPIPSIKSNITTNPSTPTASSGSSAPQPPLTHFAFSRTWHVLPNPQERFSLLTRIPPASFPALFQNSLEPELLVSILGTFKDVASSTTSSIILKYMSALPLIPRFNTVLLFLSPMEKDMVRFVWDIIDVDGNSTARRAWAI